MSHKRLLFRTEARERVDRGAGTLLLTEATITELAERRPRKADHDTTPIGS